MIKKQELKVVKYSDIYKEQVLNLKLRDIDIKEIINSGVTPPAKVLSYIVKNNNKEFNTCLLLLKEEIIAIYGTGKLKKDTGIIYFLATNKFKEFKKPIARLSKLHINNLIKPYKLLGNYVAAQNKISIRWIEWLGGNVNKHKEIQLIPNGIKFYLFTFKGSKENKKEVK